MKRATVLVSGKSGQLGQELQELSNEFSALDFIFLGRNEMDLASPESISSAFQKYNPDYVINTAAYTAVDKAESEKETAFLINATAVGHIANLCKEYRAKLIHVSTDYVFAGNAARPYLETDETAPVNYYGYSKLAGEKIAIANNPQTIIIRTSWVYSKYGNNFVKTMIRLMKDRSDLNVVSDQVGSPTYAGDLAEVILHIIANDYTDETTFQSGIYHFSNAGTISWFEFARKIAELQQFSCNVHSIGTDKFPTAAKRPHFSVMNKDKIVTTFQIQLKNWEDSLRLCLNRL